jgi:hypothetical protein
MIPIGDTVFALTEWLRTTPLVDFALWLGAKPICEWVQSHSLMVPLLQVIHILAIAMGFVSVLMFNLRLTGSVGAGLTIPQAAHRYMPWMWWSLLVLLLSGLGMILGDPIRLLINPVFWGKIFLFILMIVLSVVHAGTVSRKVASATGNWDATRGGGSAIRLSAYALIILWLCIMAGGRYMAYAPM